MLYQSVIKNIFNKINKMKYEKMIRIRKEFFEK